MNAMPQSEPLADNLVRAFAIHLKACSSEIIAQRAGRMALSEAWLEEVGAS